MPLINSLIEEFAPNLNDLDKSKLIEWVDAFERRPDKINPVLWFVFGNENPIFIKKMLGTLKSMARYTSLPSGILDHRLAMFRLRARDIAFFPDTKHSGLVNHPKIADLINGVYFDYDRDPQSKAQASETVAWIKCAVVVCSNIEPDQTQVPLLVIHLP